MDTRVSKKKNGDILHGLFLLWESKADVTAADMITRS